MHSICLSCGTVRAETPADGTACPDCSFVFDSARHARVVSFARRAVRYGYQYRRIYERDIESGVDDRRHYAEKLNEVYTFIALAILSGILGNASYDAVKAAIRRIRATYPALCEQLWEKLAAEREILGQYLLDIAARPRLIPRPVLMAIIDEVVVELAQEAPETDDPDYLKTFAESHSSQDAYDAFYQAHQRRLRAAVEKAPSTFRAPPEIDWDDLWKGAGG